MITNIERDICNMEKRYEDGIELGSKNTSRVNVL